MYATLHTHIHKYFESYCFLPPVNTVSYTQLAYSVHLKKQAVAFETLYIYIYIYIYSVVYVFLKQWKKYFYLLVMCYMLLLCYEIPQCNISDHCFLGALVISLTLSSTHYLSFCMHIPLSLVDDGYILFWHVFLTKIYTLNSSSSSCFTGSIKLFSFINPIFKIKDTLRCVP